MDNLSVWIQRFTKDDSAVPALQGVIEKEGDEHTDVVNADAGSAGLVLSDAITNEVCEFIIRMHEAGCERLLAVQIESDADIRHDAWRLLMSGASDVLIGLDCDLATDSILPRLSRWREVERLLRSPPVRENLIGISRRWRSVLSQIVELAHLHKRACSHHGRDGNR